MPAIVIQDDAKWSASPLTCAINRTSYKMTHTWFKSDAAVVLLINLQYLLYFGIAADRGWDLIHTTARCEISLSVASPFAGKRMLSLASLCSNVAPARITRTHRLTRDAACGWGVQQLVPMMWFIHCFPLAVTEGDPSRSVRDSCIR